MKERKQPPVVILQQAFFYNISILCLWLRIIRRSDQGVFFINFPSQIFFNDIDHVYRAAIWKKNSLWLPPFYMAVATYCYYEKVRRTMRTATVWYLLNIDLFLISSCQFSIHCFRFQRLSCLMVTATQKQLHGFLDPAV